MTRPDMSIKVERQLHDMRILGRIVGVRSTEQFVRHLLPPTSNGAFMNIYNIDQFQKNEYSWNPVSKRRAGNYFIKLGVGVTYICSVWIIRVFSVRHTCFCYADIVGLWSGNGYFGIRASPGIECR